MSGGGDKFAIHARAVAEQIMGEANKSLSKKDELRYGKGGSLSVDLKSGQFFDHEANEGGGVLWFIAHKTGHQVEGGAAVKWMAEHGFDIEDGPGFSAVNGQTANGTGGRPASRLDSQGNYIPKHLPDHAEIVQTYDYTDSSGDLVYQTCRYQWDDPDNPKGHGKSFIQRRPDSKNPDRWRFSIKDVKQLPYRLPELIEDIEDGLPIFVVEGEKKVDMLRDIGVPATCNSGGAGKFDNALIGHFTGADVTVVPDNDNAGRKHAQLVGARLRDVAKSVSILEIPNLPEKGSVDDWIPAGGTAEKLYELRTDLAKPWTPQAPTSNFGVVPWLRLGEPGPVVEPLIKGIAAKGEISLLVGESQSGKSFLALHFAMCVARGIPFFGKKAMQGGVLYQAGESAAGLRRRRIPAYSQHHETAQTPLPFALAQAPLDLYGSDEHANAFAAEAVEWGATFDVPLSLVVIDTLAKATLGANENDGRDMGLVLERVETIRRETGAHVMLVHHMNAGGTKARGHTSVFAGVDSVIAVKKLEDMKDINGRQVREWSISKMKEGEDGVRGRFVLPKVILGYDDDNDEVTSCIIAPPAEGENDEANMAEGKRVNGATKVVLRALYDLIRDVGVAAPPSLELRSWQKVVTRGEVSAKLKEVMSPSSDEDVPAKDGETAKQALDRTREARRKSGERARDSLYANQIIGLSDEFVWLLDANVIGFPPAPGSPRFRRKAIAEDAQNDDAPPDLPFDIEEFQ